jgi:hypothetical protein
MVLTLYRASETPRRFFRIAEHNPPARYDFTSYEERGIVPRRPLTARDRDRWNGVSHRDTLQSAIDKIGDSPWLGMCIAEIEIPPYASVRIEQTGRDLHHFTIWASADDLLSWVVSVWAIDAVP